MSVLSCPSCGLDAESGTRYCERCGTPVTDNTTRYLAAAAHMDAAFCDAALDEFTVERVRSVPPSPGADSAAVLRDAIAARTRRRIRDVALLVLVVIFAVTHFDLFLLWVVVAVVVRAGTGLRGGERSAGRTAIVLVGVLAVTGFVFAIGGPVLSVLLGTAGFGDIGRLDADETGSLLFGLLVVFLLLAVSVADSCLVHWLVHTCLRRERFVADPRDTRGGFELRMRTLGTDVRGPELDRIAEADRDALVDDTAAVVVHRGFHPFIGAGVAGSFSGLAVTLTPKDGAVPERIEVLGLHHHISLAMADLRVPTSLGPGGRLADLEIREQIMASSDELVTNLTTATGRLILPSRDRPPVPTVDLTAARGLATEPAEWARYYRCYRVETWDRDLTPSTYVHIGTDQKTLYFERVHCVVMPLASRFREIDRPVNDLLPLGQAITSLFLLPATIPGRVRGLFDKQPISQRAGESVPDRYGAAHSLRELASDTSRYRNYYQKADVHRYQEIVDRILYRSIESYLETRGFSADEFRQAFSQTIYDYRGADISNSSMGPNARTDNSGPRPGADNDRSPAGTKD